MVPAWLTVLSVLALLLGLGCAGLIALDLRRHPQPMGVMNVVWPVTALFGTLWVLWQYRTYGRAAGRDHGGGDGHDGDDGHDGHGTPFPAAVANGALHCGSGCTLGDIGAEWLVFLLPGAATWFGWHWLFADRMFATWVLDYLVALLLGVVFQYWAIRPMREGPASAVLWAAIRADTLSLTAWQVGMYGFMALAQFAFAGPVLGTRLEADQPAFWFMMQLAMLCGFLTAYPVNWWLIRARVKEAM